MTSFPLYISIFRESNYKVLKENYQYNTPYYVLETVKPKQKVPQLTYNLIFYLKNVMKFLIFFSLSL